MGPDPSEKTISHQECADRPGFVRLLWFRLFIYNPSGFSRRFRGCESSRCSSTITSARSQYDSSCREVKTGRHKGRNDRWDIEQDLVRWTDLAQCKLHITNMHGWRSVPRKL